MLAKPAPCNLAPALQTSQIDYSKTAKPRKAHIQSPTRGLNESLGDAYLAGANQQMDPVRNLHLENPLSISMDSARPLKASQPRYTDNH